MKVAQGSVGGNVYRTAFKGVHSALGDSAHTGVTLKTDVHRQTKGAITHAVWLWVFYGLGQE